MKYHILFFAGFLIMSLIVACDKDPEVVTESVVTTEITEPDVVVIETEKGENHDDSEDYSWDTADVVYIDLNGNSIIVQGSGAMAIGSVVTIASSGTYSLNGTLSDGQIIIDTEDKEIVRIILNEVDLNCASNAPIYVQNSEKTMIVLPAGTKNVVSDGTAYTSDEEDAHAAIFSKDPLTFFGDGQLSVYGNYKDGISSNDGIIIASGTISVNAKDDGILGKDYLIIKDGAITLNVEGNGLLSNKEDDVEKGYILIYDGLLEITAAGDAIQAETDVIVFDGNITASSGGGSNNNVCSEKSAKGIKAGLNLIIHAGTINIDAVEDALYSDIDLGLYGGTFYITAGDDGMHAEADLYIENSFIQIIKSYEGIESNAGSITINSGEIYITSSDDAINIAAGGDGNSGQGSSTTNYILKVNGGYIVLNASGDGIDSNGDFTITGGTVIVSGSSAKSNSAIDCDGSFLTNGGLLITTGTSQMAKAPNSTSEQYAVMINFSSAKQAGTMVHIQNTKGDNLLTFEPLKEYQSVIFSSSALINDSSYDVYYGGSSSGALSDGLFTGGVYTTGSLYDSFTISDIITTVN